jgi:hypothetical protein
VHATVKAGLLDLLDHAVDCGWSFRRACAALGLDDLRAARWQARRGRILSLAAVPSVPNGALSDYRNTSDQLVVLVNDDGLYDVRHRPVLDRAVVDTVRVMGCP